MTKSSALVKLLSLVILSMLVNSPHAGAIRCNEIGNEVYPCLFYILFGGQLPPECCNGLKSVMKAANTTTDHQNVCSCLKAFVSGATDDQILRVAGLSGQCDLSITFNITREVNCSKVN